MTQKDNGQNARGFHSAVNRLPRLPHEARALDEANAAEIYSIGPAAPLDHLHSKQLSGFFDLEIIARSPLLIGEQTEVDGQRYLSVQKTNGQPFVAPTIIKGLLSTAYERVTSSRFRVFDTAIHDHYLTYRTDPSQSLTLVPVRHTGETDSNQNLTFEILDGGKVGDNKPAYIPIKSNKKVLARRYTLVDNSAKKLITHFSHGERVLFSAHKIKRRWIVETISRIDGSHTIQIGKYRGENGNNIPPRAKQFTGYLYLTTPTETLKRNTTNFDKKWAERIFIERYVNSDETAPRLTNCDQSVLERYYATLRSYREHQESADKLKIRQGKRKVTHNVFSRTSPEDWTLTEGSLAYAVIDDNNRVSELIPISVGRHAYSQSPSVIAERDAVRPATTLEEASAADRLFGFVGNENANGTARQGRVRIGPVTVSGDAIETPPDGTEYTPLPPLLSPKPSSGRRFLVAREKFPRATGDGLRRDNLFDPAVSSLGEAAYPTHRLALGKPLADIITAYDANRDTSKDSDSVRLRVRSWLKPNTTLSCRVFFEDVSSKELAFLLWPLVPTNLAPEGSTEVGYHKIGIGKPLGLGLVEVSVRCDTVHLQDTDALALAYARLSGVLGSTSHKKSVASLIDKGEIGRLDELPWIRAFRRIAYGFDDGLPVRYVNLEENKRNNKTDKNGNPNEGCGLAPRPLWHKSAEEGYVDHFRGSGCTKKQTKKSPGKKKRHVNGNGDDTDQNRHRSKQGRRHYRKSRGH